MASQCDEMDDGEKEAHREDWLLRKRTEVCKGLVALDDIFFRCRRTARDLDSSEVLRICPANASGSETPVRRASIAADSDDRQRKRSGFDPAAVSADNDRMAELSVRLVSAREKEAVERARLEEKRLDLELRRFEAGEVWDREAATLQREVEPKKIALE
ncbi:hypothetical protein HK101_003290 [Irineochytrium annulatum]|nr:hypothetical protein HK101_003290 [Irineochytrium annulatum]